MSISKSVKRLVAKGYSQKPVKLNLLQSVVASHICASDPPKVTKKSVRDVHAVFAGGKDISGKPRVGLMMAGFARALIEVAHVSTKGAEKYAPHSWQHVTDAESKYDDALGRHVLLRATGQVFDPEFGTAELAHIAWNALALLELQIARQQREIGLIESLPK